MPPISLIIACLLLLASCQSTAWFDSVDQNPAQPALLANPSPATIAIIQGSISQALHGHKVNLNQQIFSSSNSLLLQQPQPAMDSLTAERPTPFRFSLHIDQQGCYLRYHNQQNNYRLDDSVQCRPMVDQQ